MESLPSNFPYLDNLQKSTANEFVNSKQNSLFADFFSYVEKNFKQHIDKINHSLGNYRANQSKYF